MNRVTKQWDKDQQFVPAKGVKAPEGRPCDWCGNSMDAESGAYIHKACLSKEANFIWDLLY